MTKPTRRVKQNKNVVAIDMNRPIVFTSLSFNDNSTDSEWLARNATVLGSLQLLMMQTAPNGETALVAKLREVLRQTQRAMTINSYSVTVETDGNLRRMLVLFDRARLRASWMHGTPINEEAAEARKNIDDMLKVIADSGGAVATSGIEFSDAFSEALHMALVEKFSIFNVGMRAALTMEETGILGLALSDEKGRTRAEGKRLSDFRNTVERGIKTSGYLYDLLNMLTPRRDDRGRMPKNVPNNIKPLMALQKALSDLGEYMDNLSQY